MRSFKKLYGGDLLQLALLLSLLKVSYRWKQITFYTRSIFSHPHIISCKNSALKISEHEKYSHIQFLHDVKKS